ncbi:MAG: hypothetical protein JEY99_14535 [Spirochaetales bacterium]|nr:hypothetical protein [Spirochaetales bacterium]
MKNGIEYKGFFLLFLLIMPLPIHSAESELWKKGEEAFLNNQPEQAVSFLEPLTQEQVSDNQVYLYLGIALQQLGRFQRAVEVLTMGVNYGLPPYGRLYFNMGNNYFLLEENEAAERAFSKAIEEDGAFADAILNRANTRMRLEKYVTAIGDYRLYLLQESNSPQREAIEELILRVQAYLAEVELEKQEAEARRAAEAERQRALLASVLSSLENADDDTVNMRADSEEIESFDMDLDIED